MFLATLMSSYLNLYSNKCGLMCRKSKTSLGLLDLLYAMVSGFTTTGVTCTPLIQHVFSNDLNSDVTRS